MEHMILFQPTNGPHKSKREAVDARVVSAELGPSCLPPGLQCGGQETVQLEEGL